jgi:hypothetical protein
MKEPHLTTAPLLPHQKWKQGTITHCGSLVAISIPNGKVPGRKKTGKERLTNVANELFQTTPSGAT